MSREREFYFAVDSREKFIFIGAKRVNSDLMEKARIALEKRGFDYEDFDVFSFNTFNANNKLLVGIFKFVGMAYVLRDMFKGYTIINNQAGIMRAFYDIEDDFIKKALEYAKANDYDLKEEIINGNADDYFDYEEYVRDLWDKKVYEKWGKVIWPEEK